MKVYIIGPAHPYRGGLSDFDMRMARAFQSEGCEVQLINFSLQYPNFLFPGKTQFTDDPAPKDLTIRRMVNSVNPLNWLLTGKILQQEKPDLIIVRYWLPFMGPALGTILRGVKKNKHTQVIAIADNINPHEKRIGDKQFTQYFVKPIDKFITMSKEVGQDVRLFSQQPVKTLLHPMYDVYGDPMEKQVARALLNIGQDEKVILFFGLIRKYKGLDILLEAMADERIKQANIKLLVAGEFYSNQEEYDTIIKQHDLESQLIRAMYFIPNEEVNKFFSAADVVVQPYKTATQSGITQVAFNFSKPMIVTNVGGLPEIVKHNEIGLVAEPNAKSIADAILHYYSNECETPFTEAIKEERKKYEWAYFVQQILQFNKEA